LRFLRDNIARRIQITPGPFDGFTARNGHQGQQRQKVQIFHWIFLTTVPGINADHLAMVPAAKGSPAPRHVQIAAEIPRRPADHGPGDRVATKGVADKGTTRSPGKAAFGIGIQTPRECQNKYGQQNGRDAHGSNLLIDPGDRLCEQRANARRRSPHGHLSARTRPRNRRNPAAHGP
jgi:hypothetical protein